MLVAGSGMEKIKKLKKYLPADLEMKNYGATIYLMPRTLVKLCKSST